MTVRLAIFSLILLAGAARGAPAADYKAGVARAIITPETGIWMSGYANRNRPAEGKLQDLFAKALALEDDQGRRLVLVTTDLIGFPRDLSEAVAQEVQARIGLRRDQLMLTSSHTHCGPVLRGNLVDMYDLPADQKPKLEAYADALKSQLVKMILEAVADLKPANLTTGRGIARFAVNRRQVTGNSLINGYNPDGPVDHDVPVLRVASLDGRLRAVVFGYACHNTTLQFYQWSGDYAGFAQAELEAKHQEITAMFWAGCGGDANPLPRSMVELCRKYGKELAEAVDAVLETKMTPIQGRLSSAYTTVSLDFSSLPTREQLVADTFSSNRILKARALRLLNLMNSGGRLDSEYSYYPIQVWRLGDQVLWIALGGEAVVDYALRLKRELGKDRKVWVTAYANDVMAYIPSLRVLREGGYEGESSMIGYGLPTRWGPGIEERIVGMVHQLARRP